MVIRFKKSALGKEPYRVDPRRRLAHAKRHVATEREKLGFLADVIPVESAEDRVARLNAANVIGAAMYRTRRARDWRKARAILRSLDPEHRAAVLAGWNSNAWLPADPEYLLNHLWISGINTQDPRWLGQ